MRFLLEAIKGFAEPTHIVRVLKANLSWRLFHVNLHCEITVKKCIFNIKLTDMPITRDNNVQDGRMVAGLTTTLKVPSKSRSGC